MTKLLPIQFIISTKVEVYPYDLKFKRQCFKCASRVKNTLQMINVNGSMDYEIVVEFFNFEKKLVYLLKKLNRFKSFYSIKINY